MYNKKKTYNSYHRIAQICKGYLGQNKLNWIERAGYSLSEMWEYDQFWRS